MADYQLEEGLDKKFKNFSMKGTGGHAMILKIDNGKDEIQEVETMTGKSTADMAEYFDESNEPRYMLYIHTVKHADGRGTCWGGCGSCGGSSS